MEEELKKDQAKREKYKQMQDDLNRANEEQRRIRAKEEE